MEKDSYLCGVEAPVALKLLPVKHWHQTDAAGKV